MAVTLGALPGRTSVLWRAALSLSNYYFSALRYWGKRFSHSLRFSRYDFPVGFSQAENGI